ncbi:MAG: glycoside hydrolase family 3 protein, partial [Oscillospiraceae bacterium]
MINLKDVPFCLNDEDIKWVEDTIADMSDEEKIGQLFFGISASYDEKYLTELTSKYHIGGCRYNPAPGAVIRKHNEVLQRYSKIPLFIACNTESGGNGACADGTYIGSGIKVGATGEKKYAYQLGKISNEEAAAIGCNMAFAPVCDIAYNWQNTEIISRAFGNDPDKVAEMSTEYLKGAHSIDGFVCAAKHFPGNGLDFRDAHLSNNVNSFSFRNWNESYGKVYKMLIKNGLEAVMAGHIMLPEYIKALNPNMQEEDMLPATLSYEIITGLLREQLGFNGLVITDASHMVGMTCRMKRCEMLPKAINAGCDMLLFFNDADEDIDIMLRAYREGRISETRINDALTRILGLKAHMGLNKKSKEQLVPSEEKMSAVLGKKEYLKVQKEISEKAITLVKYKDKDVLPITPKRYKRIMLVHVKGAENGMTALMKAVGMSGGSPVELLKQKLTEKGFEVFVYENPLDKMLRQAQAGEKPELNEFFAGKNAVSDFTSKMDLVITVCDVQSGRPCFGLSKGGGEIPWYVFEVPVIIIGCESPTMLADIPQARTYINTYDSKETTLDILVDKLMKGPAAFYGKDPIDSFCGLADTR